MIENANRIGNFTSSEIAKLMTSDRSGKGFGKPALTYIAEKKMERRLGRSIDTESNARPLTWGKHIEQFVFEQLPISYSYNSDQTILHPTIKGWSGSPDGFKFYGESRDAVIDIKCPMTPKSFCQLVDPLYDGLKGMEAMEAIRKTHDKGEEYYWQLVSNAIISGCDKAELIVFMPYQSELDAIRHSADGISNLYWVWAASDNELPYLNDGGFYKNLNTIRFEVPKRDKEALAERVRMALEILDKEPHVITAAYDTETKATIIQ